MEGRPEMMSNQEKTVNAFIVIGCIVLYVICAAASCQGAERVPTGLVAALIAVESNGRDDAIGDNGQAVGCLQLHPSYVADANRILGRKRWTLKDRLSRVESVEMFYVVATHYAKHNKDFSAQGIARRHNGGPRGHKWKSTLGYWAKVRKAMK